MELPSKSYHDVTVIVDGKEFNLFNSTYGYELICTRVDGWELWFRPGTPDEKQIGGEYGNNHFQIKFGDLVVFDNNAK